MYLQWVNENTWINSENKTKKTSNVSGEGNYLPKCKKMPLIFENVLNVMLYKINLASSLFLPSLNSQEPQWLPNPNGYQP